MNLIAIPISGVIVKSLVVLAGFGSVPIKSYPVGLLVGGFIYIRVSYAKI